MQKGVIGFLFSDDLSRVILIRKNSPEWQAGKMNGVGGKVKDGETSHQAMVREFHEEAGAVVSAWEPVAILKWPHYELTVFSAAELTAYNCCRSMTEEPLVVRAVQHLHLETDLIPNLHWLIPLAIARIKFNEPPALIIYKLTVD